MAPRKNKTRTRSLDHSLDEFGTEEEALTVATRPRVARKKADWDTWQDTARVQEADRVRQYMNTFQNKVIAVRKKALQDLRQTEDSLTKGESEFLNDVRAACGREHTEWASAEMPAETSASSSLPLREVGDQMLGLLKAMLAHFEQTSKDLQEQCSCSASCTAASTTGEDGPSVPVQAAWNRDHEEARKLLQYGRTYGESLVHDIIVPQSSGNASSPIAVHADSIGLDRTGRSAIGLFPRSRATLVGGQTWGETARMQMQALKGIVQTLPER